MPAKTVHCSICHDRIRGKDFPERMAKLRRHPSAWRNYAAIGSESTPELTKQASEKRSERGG